MLKTADRFDREAKTGVTDYGVTIKAEDGGSPSLAGFCTFRVKIGDKNDNPPVFDLPAYETSLEEGSIIGKKVLQVGSDVINWPHKCRKCITKQFSAL